MPHMPYYYYCRLCDNVKDAKGCSVRYGDDLLSLQYHDTVVASYNFATRELTLDHGGWRTYYTKERINRFCDVLGLGVRVSQHRKRFYVDVDRGGQTRESTDWGHIDDGDDPTITIILPLVA